MKKRNDLIKWVCASVIAASLPLSANANAKEISSKPSTALAESALEQSFKTPPASAQAWCFWWWFNGLASKEGITRDFEEMKRQGISGALLFDANTGGKGVPHGPDFMSSEWRELFKFAVKEADRLDITLTANLSRTWNAGGPWVTPEHGIKKITHSAHQFKGPGKTNFVLPKAQGRLRHYRDIAVLACPIPDDLSGKKEVWKRDQMVDVRQFMNAEGRLVWDAPTGNWSILRIGYQATGMRVAKSKRDLEIDPMSAEAMDLHFAHTGAKMIEDAGPLAGKTFQYLHIDSWEIKQPDWTTKMPAEFLKRRGYDLTKWLPALCGRQVDSEAATEKFLQDFRVTVCDLIADNYYGRLDALAKEGGLMGSHSEAGGPIGAPHTFWLDALKFHGTTAIPMGEFWIKEFKGTNVSYERNHTIKQIASAAHIYGKEICQAEAFTAYRDVFASDPYKIKGAGDLAFCDGLTRMVFHQWIHQPDLDMVPGYWSRPWKTKEIGTKFGHTLTWWPMADGWLSYLARCQYMLRQGKFVADFAYLQDQGIPSYVLSRPGENPRCPQGCDYDALHADVLLEATANEGRLQLQSGMSYRYLVLPPNGLLKPTTQKKIKQLAEAGVQVIGSGYREGSLEKILSADGLAQDVEFRKASANAHFEQIHRRDGETDIFFISNQAVAETHADVIFRVSGKQPELWNPVTGEARELPEWREENGRTVVPLEFAPKESCFVVFRKQAQSKKRRGAKNFPELTALKPLSGPWQVAFDPKWGGPEAIVFDELIDWTKHKEPGIKYYSGSATYRKTFDYPVSSIKHPASRVFLDLGKLSCIARVRLNGKDLGVVWTAPWRLEITDAVRSGENQLEIEVANHWTNRIIGDEKLPPEQRFTQTNVKAQRTPLQPSGLLGPVSLLTKKH